MESAPPRDESWNVTMLVGDLNYPDAQPEIIRGEDIPRRDEEEEEEEEKEGDELVLNFSMDDVTEPRPNPMGPSDLVFSRNGMKFISISLSGGMECRFLENPSNPSRWYHREVLVQKVKGSVEIERTGGETGSISTVSLRLNYSDTSRILNKFDIT